MIYVEEQSQTLYGSQRVLYGHTIGHGRSRERCQSRCEVLWQSEECNSVARRQNRRAIGYQRLPIALDRDQQHPAWQIERAHEPPN
jgi:hypothetical protein